MVPDLVVRAPIRVGDFWHQHLAVDMRYKGWGPKGFVNIVKLWVVLEMVTDALQGRVVLPVRLRKGPEIPKVLEVKDTTERPWYACCQCTHVYGTHDAVRRASDCLCWVR